MSHPSRTIVASAAGRFGDGVVRARPHARIAATHWICGSAVAGRLDADFDACFLDGAVVATVEDWRAVIGAGRLAAVTGQFALAWTDADGTLHLARDGIGGRALFYAPIRDGCVFASSLRAILDTGRVDRAINRRAVATYLTYAYLPGRETLAAGVFEVQAGEHVVVAVDGAMRRDTFWHLPAPALSTAPEADMAAELRRLLETATHRLLPPSGEAVGVFLSGGLDSSLVTALAARLHDAPARTFSVSFGAGTANELEHSSLVAAHCGTDHRIVELTPSAVLAHLDRTIALLSDPIGDPLTVPNALLFREASNHVGVVLNGEGGDPCFGGPKNLPMLLAELYAMPGESHAAREVSYLRAHQKCYDDLADMLTPSMLDVLRAAPLEADIAAHLADPRYPDTVARLQATNIRIKGAHHILPKVEALSAPFGVLPRAPLFDRAVVEMSLAIPSRLKLKGTIEKYLLKEAVRDLLPASILKRPKSGMLVPVEAWCRGPMLGAARARLLDGLGSRDLIRRDWMERLLAGQMGGLRPRHGIKIWLLLTLEAWLREVLDG